MTYATEQQRITYNGWSNRETWLANLWLTNEEGSYTTLMKAVENFKESWKGAEWLKNRLEDQLDCEIEVPCLWQDLLQDAFSHIDWIEIIENNQEIAS